MVKKIALKNVINTERFDAITCGYRGAKALVTGDLILDRFVYGNVSRISPEAPVPVVLVQKEECMLGGAGNVALNIRALGASPFLVATVGKDENARVLKALLEKEGIDSFLLEREQPTTTKTRVIAKTQQVARIDNETIDRLSPHEMLTVKKVLMEKCSADTGMIISDYNKGFVTKQLISMLSDIKKSSGCILTVDPKVEHFPFYRNVTCITPNKSEASMFLNRKEPEEISHIEKLAGEIKKRIHCENLLITLGKDGMLLLEENRRATHIPTAAREVFDVTGAGDTVIGVLTLSLAAGASVLEAAAIANLAAGIIVAKLGTASASLKELRNAFSEKKDTQCANILG